MRRILRQRKQRGAISIPLILVLVVIVVFASLELSALVVSQSEISGSQSRSEAAFRAAESGAHDALKRLSRDFTYTCASVDCYSIDTTQNGCSTGDGCAYVQVTGTGTSVDPKIITSRGISRGAERTIQVTAEFDTALDGKIVSAEWTEVLAGQSVNWASGWNYRKAITIQAAQVSGSANHTNFPVLIDQIDTDWRDTVNGGKVAQTDGGDIRFTSANGSTKLSHEIENYNPVTGALVAWVKVPVLDFDDDTTIYIYYGNTSGGLYEQDAVNVWDSNYRMVYHLGESAGVAITDSTANQKHGVKLSTAEPAATVSGQINGAQSFDGTDARIEVPNPNLPTGDYTYSTWVDMTAVDDESFFMASDGTGANEFVFIAHTTLDVISNNVTVLTTSGSIGTANPTHLAVTRSGNLITVYIDGTADANTANEGVAYDFSTCQLMIGTDIDAAPCDSTFGNFVSGIMDEVRISDIARSPDWIQTEFNNQNSPSAFYTVGPEEQEAGWPSGWAYRNSITIQSSQVSGSVNHTNFPVLVSRADANWADTGNGGNVAQTDGGDIMFTASDGITQLSHEIESYDNTTGALVAWVRIPVLQYNSDTQMYIYYGNNSGGLDEQDIPGVWDSNYMLVQHLEEGDSTAADFYKDSTSYGRNGTLTDADGDSTTATKLDGALTFNGDADYISTSYSGVGGATDRTVSAWIKTASINAIAGWGTTASGQKWHIRINDSAADGTVGALRTEAMGSFEIGQTVLTDNVWHYVVSTFSGSDITDVVHYIDGGTDDGSSGNGGPLAINTATTQSVLIAARDAQPPVEYFFGGDIDEVRISDAVRSSDWIQTEFNNQNNPGTFYTVGPQQSS